MSSNVLKLSKQHSQPNNSTPSTLISSSHSLHQLHHLSIDNPKERESVLHLKDIQPNTASSQTGIKKLAYFLDPRKDLHTSVSPTHTSPKSFLGPSSTKSNKLKISASSLENSNLNLISPKDLVRLAMSKHKPKAAVKKVTVESTSSLPRNVRKSLSLRFGPGATRSEKQREGSTSKITSTSIIEENSMLSKTSLPLNQDKSAKLKRMKLIYNDMTQPDLARLTKSTAYTPQEASGRMWQGTVSPNRSNSGLLWPGSPNGPVSATSGGNKSKLHLNQIGVGGSDKVLYGKELDEEKGEKSYRKRTSIEQVGSFLKDLKPVLKQKRQDKKNVQPRKMTSMDNPKATSASFSRLMSHNTLNQDAIERAKSPTGDLKANEDEVDETMEVFGETESVKAKPREEFIADLKNWVNDIVKPVEDMPVMASKKNAGAAEKVKECQEGLLEKLREALDNDEFVRREDYERLYREKDSIEEELDAVKEENAQLRAMLWRIQEENEAREQREIEERKASKSSAMISSYYDQPMTPSAQESAMRLNKEFDTLKKRENVVKDILRMIWKAGIEIGDLQVGDLMKENQDFYDEQEAYDQQQYENYYANQMQKQGYMLAEQYKMHEKYTKNLQPIGENIYKEGDQDESYTDHIPEQGEEDSEATSRKPIALSEMGDSEPALSVRQPLEVINRTQGILINAVNKMPLSNQPKSTADSSLLYSGKPATPQSCLPRSQGKLKLDLTGLGGNVSVPKSSMMSGNSSIEKINNYVKTTDGGQSVGFHEEFMSKLEEFSLSWRQDALNYQKF